jgi:CDP-glycerol glycerophosphotransferase
VAGVSLISVVVPIYDVEDYLEECLQSLARQTVRDFEAVMVDDGSTDASAAIAERFAASDDRFRLLRQPNGGLSRARNTGIDAAGGEYLAFLDSDDVLPPDAYELLLGAVERTGSDFATGNVQRLHANGCTQAGFVAAAFARTRLRTHVRQFAPLLEDRTAWNKLWRRAFWDARELRFPDGRLHEDIPVVLPAHFQAASVDVVGAPVYRYRVREAGAPSITQRRHELRALRDRLAAVAHVHGYLRANESARHRRRYERSVVRHDLRYHLDLLPEAGDEYRTLFMEWAAAFLHGAGSRVCDELPAIDRAKYHLVRRGRLAELLELLAFQRAAALRTPPRRRMGRYYGAYPPLPVPRSARRLGRRDQELALTAHLEAVSVEHGRLRLTGHAYVNALGAASPDAQRLEIAAVPAASRRALRMRFAPTRLATMPLRRRDLEPRVQWSGFRASIAPSALLGSEEWEIFASVRSGGLRRRRAVFVVDDPSVVRTIDVPAGDDVLVQATVSADGRARIAVPPQWVRVESHRRIGGVLELTGRARVGGGAELELAGVRFPLAVAGSSFSVRLDLADLGDGEWNLAIAGARLSLSDALSGAAWRSGGRDMALERTASGGGRLVVRDRVQLEPAARPEIEVSRAASFGAGPRRAEHTPVSGSTSST